MTILKLEDRVLSLKVSTLNKYGNEERIFLGVAKKSTSIAFWLTVIPGLLIGLSSLGYLYLGKINRGYFFLAFSFALWYLLVVYYVGPWDLSAYVGLGIAVMWFFGWIAGILDIRNQIRNAEKKQVISKIEHVIRQE